MTMLVLFLEDQVVARVEEMPVKLERLDHLVDHQQIPHLDIDKDILVEQPQPGYSAPYCGAGGGGAGGAAATVENDGIGTGGAGVQVLIAGSPTLTGVGATGPSSPTGQWFGVVAVVEVMFRNLMYHGAPPGNSLA